MTDEIEREETTYHRRVLADMFELYREAGRSSGRRATYGSRSRSVRSTSADWGTADDAGEQRADEGADSEVTQAGWEALRGEFGTGVGSWAPGPGMHRSRTGTGRSPFDPRKIGEVLKVERHRRGWNRPISVGTIIGQWESIVGKVVAQHCPVESFEGGKLVVQADSTAWAQQLQLLLPQVHRRIDEEVGSGVVEQVVVRGPKAPSWKKGLHSVPGRGPRDTYG